MPGASVFILFLDLQVISTGLSRGKMCYTDTPSTSTDPLVSRGLWRTSTLLFLMKILGKRTSLLLTSAGGKDWVQKMVGYLFFLHREKLLNWNIKMSLIVPWLAAFSGNGCSLSSFQVGWPIIITQFLSQRSRENVDMNLKKKMWKGGHSSS